MLHHKTPDSNLDESSCSFCHLCHQAMATPCIPWSLSWVMSHGPSELVFGLVAAMLASRISMIFRQGFRFAMVHLHLHFVESTSQRDIDIILRRRCERLEAFPRALRIVSAPLQNRSLKEIRQFQKGCNMCHIRDSFIKTQRHTWYLSPPPPPAVVYFFQAGVPF